jgi:hypothetical protein
MIIGKDQMRNQTYCSEIRQLMPALLCIRKPCEVLKRAYLLEARTAT